jgi:hypothetical protein
MYALPAVQGHDTCPFCKETFPEGKFTACPSCEVQLIPSMRAGGSVDAALEDDDGEDGDPELPWTHWGHARGPVLVACLLGLLFFFLPWVRVFTPDAAVHTGLDLARRTGMAWAAAVGWFTLLPAMLSRRTIRKLRGARLAAALLSFIPALVAALFLMNPPGSLQAGGVSLRIRFEWGIGLYLTLALGLLTAIYAALRLGKP